MRTLLALGLAAGVCLAASPALAHDDQGVLVGGYVADPADSPEGTYRARLTYANDGHPAEGATVTLTATDGAGGTVGPMVLVPTDLGEYEAAVRFPNPGRWTVTVVADAPVGLFSEVLTISDPLPDLEVEDPAEEEIATEATAGEGGGSDAGILLGGLVAGALAAAAALASMLIWRRRSRAP